MKKFILTASILILLFLLLPSKAQAASASGSCGTGVTWSLDGSTLTISGSGAIKSYSTGSAPWYPYRSSIYTIIVEDGITLIPEGTFHGCGYISSLKVPFVGEKVKKASDTYRYPLGYIFGKSYYASGTNVTQAYYGSSNQFATTSSYYIPNNLREVTITGGLVSYGALDGFEDLTKVYLGAGVTDVESSAMDECSNLSRIWVDDANPYIKSDAAGALIGNGGTKLVQFPANSACGEYTIPDGVTEIGGVAFKNCQSLLELTIPEGVKRIAGSAFYKCVSIRSLHFPDSMEYIGTFAFRECRGLKTVSFGSCVLRIEQDPFMDCTNLTDVYISDLGKWCESSFHSYSSNPMYMGKNVYVDGKPVQDLVIPYGVTKIVNDAFYKWTSLRSVVIPETVTSIGYQAFTDCTGLMVAVICPGITELPTQMFDDCTSLKVICLPDTITTIDYNCFKNCSNLSHIAYAGTQTQWDKIVIDASNTLLVNATRHNLSGLKIINDCRLFSASCTGCTEPIIYEPTGLNHQFTDSVIVKPATFISDGLHQITCTACTYCETETLPMLVGNVQQWNMTLADHLQVNFYLQVSSHIVESGQVIVTVADHLQTYALSSLPQTDAGLYQLKIPIAAAQMHDQIRIAVVYGGIVGPTMNYCVRDYADTLLADSAYAPYHPLIRQMLNYGMAAQKYFDYNASGLVPVRVEQTPIPHTAPADMTVSGNLGNVEYYGASLVYADRIAVRFYFQSATDLGGFIFSTDSPYTIGIADNMVYIEVLDILPQDLDQSITLTVSDADSQRMTVTYSPMNYLVRMNQTGNAATKELVTALYNYHLAAKQLLN